jgi:hypothetical protein
MPGRWAGAQMGPGHAPLGVPPAYNGRGEKAKSPQVALEAFRLRTRGNDVLREGGVR